MSVRKESYRKTFTIPAGSGDYAPEFITFGEVGPNRPPESFQGVTVVVDSSVATMTVELWLPRIGESVDSNIPSFFVYSGKSIGATGSETWALAGYPGAQLRTRSGGTGGNAIVGASAF